MLCCWRSCIVSKQPEANTTVDAISSSFPPYCCHGECMPFCMVATETPTSQPISCSHISTWSFIFLSYTTALEKQHRGPPSGVDANIWCSHCDFAHCKYVMFGNIMTDVNIRSFPLLTLFTLVFFHIIICLFESLSHSYLHQGQIPLGSAVRLHVCVSWITCVHAKSLRKTRKTTNDLPLSFPEEFYEYWGTKMHLPAGIWLSSLIISTCLGSCQALWLCTIC